MEKFDLQKETYLLLAERAINYFDCTKYVDWAITALENGYESESLFVIAGLDREYKEVVDSYFKLAVQELNLKIDFEDSIILDTYAKHIMQELIDKSIDAEKGLTILVKIYEVSNYDKRYSAFSNLDYDIGYLGYDEYSIYNSRITLDNKTEYIIDECKLFLEYQDMKISDEITKYAYCEDCHEIETPVLKKENIFFRKINTWRCNYCNSKHIYLFEDQMGRKRILAHFKQENEK
jgi:hypothetical protein